MSSHDYVAVKEAINSGFSSSRSQTTNLGKCDNLVSKYSTQSIFIIYMSSVIQTFDTCSIQSILETIFVRSPFGTKINCFYFYLSQASEFSANEKKKISTKKVSRLVANVPGMKNAKFIFIKMGYSRPLFLYFRLFNTVDSKCSI